LKTVPSNIPKPTTPESKLGLATWVDLVRIIGKLVPKHVATGPRCF
jgi:hypothetical protein